MSLFTPWLHNNSRTEGMSWTKATWAVTPSLHQVSHQSSRVGSDLVTRSEIWLIFIEPTRSQHTMWPDEWISSSAAAVKLRETLWWVWQVELTLGRKQRRSVWSICLRVRSSKKSERKGSVGGRYWLPSWLKRAALERITSVYPCGHFHCSADMAAGGDPQYSGFNFSSLVRGRREKPAILLQCFRN